MSQTPSQQNAAIEQAIRDAVANPASVSGDAGSVSNRSLREMIEAEKYFRSKNAARKTYRGVRMSLIENGGPTG